MCLYIHLADNDKQQINQIWQYHNNPFIYDTWEVYWRKSDNR